MRVLVTGAAGFVGRGLLPALSASGHSGWATGRTPPSELPVGWRSAARADVLSGKTVPTGLDAVVHLEVKHHVPRPTRGDIKLFDDVNVGGTRQWLEWAAKHHVPRFIYLSTIKATVSGDPDGAESRPAALDSDYGRSKAAAEAAVRDWVATESGRTAIVLRPVPVYGPGNEANFAAFVRQVIAGRPCLIGTGDAVKSIVSRRNLAAAIEFGLSLETAGCEAFNVSDRQELTLRELASMIASLAGAPPPRGIPRPLAGMAARFGDLVAAAAGREFMLTTGRLNQMLVSGVFPCSKLLAAGFQHPQTTRQGLAEMLDWMAREGWLRRATRLPAPA